MPSFHKMLKAVCSSSEIAIKLMLNGHNLKFREIEIRKPRVMQKTEKIDKRTLGRKAPANHSWKIKKPDISKEFQHKIGKIRGKSIFLHHNKNLQLRNLLTDRVAS
jgi:hypothetical protein